MNSSYDVIVIGLGAMGSAAAYHLARRGQRVLGLERFTSPHALGSSHGQTRVIREAYFEDSRYVPIVQRAYQLWDELERASGKKLFVPTGGLMIGAPDSVIVKGARDSAQLHGLKYESLSAKEVRSRFPGLQPPDAMTAIFEPRAGVLFVEKCIEAHLDLARKHGAQLQFEEPVLSWQTDGDGVRVMTDKGSYRAAQILVTAGGWTKDLLAPLNLPLVCERQVMYWFEPKDVVAAVPCGDLVDTRRQGTAATTFSPSRFPVFIVEHQTDKFFYGLPDLGWGVKVARHHEGETTAPDTVRRTVEVDEINGMKSLVQRFLPDAFGRFRASSVCFYTNTPDQHFLLDRHPQHPQILIASPCSGHGFKFSSAMGEILADLLTKKQTPFDLSFFGLNRFR